MFIVVQKLLLEKNFVRPARPKAIIWKKKFSRMKLWMRPGTSRLPTDEKENVEARFYPNNLIRTSSALSRDNPVRGLSEISVSEMYLTVLKTVKCPCMFLMSHEGEYSQTALLQKNGSQSKVCL